MQFISRYISPLGNIILAADATALSGLWFEGQRHFELDLDKVGIEKETHVLRDAGRWLDIYFSGKEPDFKIPLRFSGTPFQNEVWEILSTVPYGKTVSYKELASIISKRRGIPRMSAQAVGGAVGKNKISVIIPCHRVLGADGSPVGYAGGIGRKKALLRLEGINL